MLKSFFGSADDGITVWTADWRDSTKISTAALQYWTHPDRNVIRVGMRPNKRGKMRPAYFATVEVSDIRDAGATMGPEVIEGVWAQQQWALVLAEEWRPRFSVVFA